jgi:hypothetical protein
VGITETNVTRGDGEIAADMSQAQGGGAGTAPVTPGAAGGPSVMASGGQGGSSAQLGSAGGSSLAGSAGAPMMTGVAGTGPDAGVGVCAEQSLRCGSSGREVCTADEWLPQPCPANAPVCEGEGQCAGGGPALVSVGGAFFVDATEVTVAQYRRFLEEKNGDMSGQIPACSWNQSYFEEVAFEPDDEPIRMVDWCDANAFCTWAHKRLCGRVSGGPITIEDLDDETENEWYLACGGPNGNLEPNDAMECNLSDGFRGVAPVATYPGCEGYYPGVFDMLGNVWEWIDSCQGDTGPDDVCAPMGGSTIDGTDAFCFYYSDTLTGTEPWRRDDKILYAGIRCCAD